MLLAVDIGNTNIKFGTFVGGDLISRFSVPTAAQDHFHDLGSALGPNLNASIDSVIICSVVPEMNERLAEFLSRHLQVEPVFVTNDTDFGLSVEHDPLSSIGTDRLVNSFSAAELYGAPCIVCSFGTATTFDVVDRTRVLLGGVIAPGMKTMARALNTNTANLPEVEIEKPPHYIGTTTVTAIQSGIFYGHIALVEGIVERLKEGVGEDVKVIATGGSAALTAENTEAISIVDENLLLHGLRLLKSKLSHHT